jgi:hypothetical protein
MNILNMDIIIDNVHDTTDEIITDLIPLVFPFNYYPPTFTYTNNTQTFHVTIEYCVILQVHIRGAYHTLKTGIPLMIGFEPTKISFDEVSIADQKRFSNGRLRSTRTL